MYALGCVPSRKDYRDYRYSAHFPVAAEEQLPSSFSYPKLPPEVWDQGQYPMCVGYAVAMWVTIMNAVERGVWEEYSPAFAYCNRYPGQYMGPGAEPRDILANLIKDGDCKRSTFNRSYHAPLPSDITPEMRNEATPQKALSYCAVQTVREIKTAIMKTGPVLYCIPVHWNFYSPMPDGTIDPVDQWGGFAGGYHATLAVGWKPGHWRILNSWGKGWGQNGYCWLPWDYPLSEAWAVTDFVPRGKTIELWIGKYAARVNGAEVKLDQPPSINPLTGRTLVPLRFVSEILGAAVEWDEADKKITITKD